MPITIVYSLKVAGLATLLLYFKERHDYWLENASDFKYRRVVWSASTRMGRHFVPIFTDWSNLDSSSYIRYKSQSKQWIDKHWLCNNKVGVFVNFIIYSGYGNIRFNWKNFPQQTGVYCAGLSDNLVETIKGKTWFI